MTSLSGKIAFVTGAGQGIGLAIANRFAGSGATLVLADVSPAVHGVAEDLAGRGVRAVGVVTDVTDRPSVEAAFETAADRVGVPDVLVNNAGIFGTTPFEELSFDQWSRMMAVNVHGAFHVSQTFIRRLLAARSGGAIVNMGSVSGQIAFNGSSAYNVSKAALHGLTRCLAVEFAQFGIRCNAVAPGIIETEMTRPALSDPALAAEWLQRIPSRTYGTVADVADAVAFLASDASRYVNGEILVVDGGALPNWSKPGDQGREIRRDWYPADRRMS